MARFPSFPGYSPVFAAVLGGRLKAILDVCGRRLALAVLMTGLLAAVGGCKSNGLRIAKGRLVNNGEPLHVSAQGVVQIAFEYAKNPDGSFVAVVGPDGDFAVEGPTSQPWGGHGDADGQGAVRLSGLVQLRRRRSRPRVGALVEGSLRLPPRHCHLRPLARRLRANPGRAVPYPVHPARRPPSRAVQLLPQADRLAPF